MLAMPRCAVLADTLCGSVLTQYMQHPIFSSIKNSEPKLAYAVVRKGHIK